MIHKSIEVVSVKHYSEAGSFKSIVLDTKEDIVVLKLSKDFTNLNFLEGDPIIIGYELDKEVYICEGTIIKVNLNSKSIEIKYKSEEILINKRISERFPVSLYAEILVKSSRKRDIALIKDISLSGMAIKSKTEFDVEQEIELDVYLGKTVIALKGNILWKREEGERFQYGVQTIYSDLSKKNTVKTNLQIIKDEQEKAIRELKE